MSAYLNEASEVNMLHIAFEVLCFISAGICRRFAAAAVLIASFSVLTRLTSSFFPAILFRSVFLNCLDYSFRFQFALERGDQFRAEFDGDAHSACGDNFPVTHNLFICDDGFE